MQHLEQPWLTGDRRGGVSRVLPEPDGVSAFSYPDGQGWWLLLVHSFLTYITLPHQASGNHKVKLTLTSPPLQFPSPVPITSPPSTYRTCYEKIIEWNS